MSLIITPESGETLTAPPEAALSLTGASAFRQTAFLNQIALAGFRRVELGGGPEELGDPRRMMGLALSELQKHLRQGELSASAIRSATAVGSANLRVRQASRDAILSTIDLAHSLDCTLVVVGTEICGSDADDASRYALDILHDVATSLSRSGVGLALAGVGNGSFLGQAGARNHLLREAPSAVGLSLADTDLAGLESETISSLGQAAVRASLSAHEVPRQGLELTDEGRASTLLSGLARSGFSGPLAVQAELNHPNREELQGLYQRLIGFVGNAFV